MAFKRNNNVIDSPGNSFATLNPLKNWTGHGYRTLSDGNLHISPTSVGSQYGSVDASILLPNSGKFYFEVYTYASAGVGNWAHFGIVKSNYNPPSNSYTLGNGDGDFSGISLNFYSDMYQEKMNQVQIGSNYTIPNKTDNIFSIIVDIDNSSIEGWHNGTKFGTWGTLASSPAGYAIAASVSTHATNRNDIKFNFGQDHTFAGEKTDSAGHPPTDGSPGLFYYEPPEGAKALCSANLPMTIENPQEHFRAVTWTGDGSNPRKIPIGFDADFVWIKNRTGNDNSHATFDSVRGFGKKHLWIDLPNGETANEFGHVDSVFDNNIVLNAGNSDDTYVNNSEVDYVAWSWKAGGGGGKYNIDGVPYLDFANTGLTAGDIEPTGMSVNTKAGFSIVKYNATSSIETVPHGLNKKPELMIFKTLDSNDSWAVITYMNNEDKLEYMYLNAADGINDCNWGSLPTEELMSVYQYNRPVIAYCWHSVPGYSVFGSYTGNGSADGPSMYCGFRPAFVMLKRTDTSGYHWMIYDSSRNSYNPVNEKLYANSSGDTVTASDLDIDFLSSGFKVRGDSVGVNSGSFIFMAFAEQPIATKEKDRYYTPKIFNINKIVDTDVLLYLRGGTTSATIQDAEYNITSSASLSTAPGKPFANAVSDSWYHLNTNGSSSYINIGNSQASHFSPSNYDDFTIEFWLQPYGTNGSYGHFYWIGGQGNEGIIKYGGTSSSGGGSSHGLYFYTTITEIESGGAGSLIQGNWHWIVIEKFGSINSIWVNGSRKEQKTFTWPTQNETNSFKLGYSAPQNVEHNSHFFDELRITARARYEGASTIPVQTNPWKS